ncbi:MAG: phosphate ABC transporter permease subunit PstC [Actinomycetota bacterium]|nr:phosphate ABC transporter permease subunit PstC [Actinomycetota bacterium]
MTDPPSPSRSAASGDTGTQQRSVSGGAASVPEVEIRGTEPESVDLYPKKAVLRIGDRVFQLMAIGSGAFIVLLIGGIGLFLLIQAIPPLLRNQENFLTFREFLTGDVDNLRFGILDLLLVTVEVSVVALVLAMPIALGIALFLTQYAPDRLARPFAYAVDLLAAVPSIIFGLWGIFVLAPVIEPFTRWLNDNLGFIFLFSDGNIPISRGANLFTAGIVLAVMILPIITAITRDVFAQTPKPQIEGAQALGATRWEVITTVVLPFGRAGYVSASMLGLGRALGETIALAIILAATPQLFSGSLFDGGATFASKIALAAQEFNNPLQAGAYIAAGLVLFVLTFAVNAIARSLVAKKEYYS